MIKAQDSELSPLSLVLSEAGVGERRLNID